MTASFSMRSSLIAVAYLPPRFLDTPWRPGMRQAEVGQPKD